MKRKVLLLKGYKNCKGHSQGLEEKIKLDYNYGYPPTVNHQKETQFAGEVAKEIVGEQNVTLTQSR